MLTFCYNAAKLFLYVVVSGDHMTVFGQAIFMRFVVLAISFSSILL